VQQLEEAPVATVAQALALRDAVLDRIDQELETTEPAPPQGAGRCSGCARRLPAT
jgi:hypothetical protein